MNESQSRLQHADLPTPVDVSLFEENGRTIVRNQAGLALYRYDRDVDGKSHCNDACSNSWPPFLASADASPVVGEWRTIPREGARQWTFRRHPIYTYSQDAPGTARGDGLGGVWHLVAP